MNRRTLFKSFTGIVAASALQCFGFKAKVLEVKKNLKRPFLSAVEKGILPDGIGYNYHKIVYTRSVPTGPIFNDPSQGQDAE
jgi:hypothetical protein